MVFVRWLTSQPVSEWPSVSWQAVRLRRLLWPSSPLHLYGRPFVPEFIYNLYMQWYANLESRHISAFTLSFLVNFHPNSRRPWPSFSRSKFVIEYVVKFIPDFLENGDRYGNHFVCKNKYKSHVSFRLSYLHLTLVSWWVELNHCVLLQIVKGD